MRSSRHLVVVFVDNVEGAGDQIRHFMQTRKQSVNN